MKYRICDLQGFKVGVYGADCFLKNFPELHTAGVELKKFGTDFYIMLDDGRIADTSCFFNEKEMEYLTEVVDIIKE